jgi:hypothetical protein
MHKVDPWHDGNGEHGLSLEFWGDGQGHRISVGEDDARFFWDDTSRVLTIKFEYGSERCAEDIYWRLLEIIPALRKDRR